MSEDISRGVLVSINKQLAEHVSHIISPKQHRVVPILDPTFTILLPKPWEMKEDKLRYLQSFLKRRNETSLDRYITAMAKLQERLAMKCYNKLDHEFKYLTVEETVEQMLLMSCFIAELFRKYANKELRERDDPIFNVAENLHYVRRYLIKLENQIPFFVLVEFFNMTKIEGANLVDLALHFFQSMVGLTLKPPHEQIPINRIDHLLDLIHYNLCPSFAERVIPSAMEKETEREFMNYASELNEAGVNFKMIKGFNVRLLNISFKNGEMKIPPLKVAECTMDLLENLICHEKGFPSYRRRYVSDYIKFMNCLLNSPKDMEVLRRNGIIENWMGNDKVILEALDKLSNGVEISRIFTYSGVMKEVNQHCMPRRNIWMAKLKRNYFSNPWSFISFIAAVMLLLLTVTQTVYSILSYYKTGN